MKTDFTAAVPLPRCFYDRDPVVVARELLGKLLVRRTLEGICAGRIVETEAYLARNDPACHAHRGRTRKNATMFGRPGLLYVYPIHARWCMNVVTEPRGIASAVLLRAIEPLEGIPSMQRRRVAADIRNTARGPARLCQALQVDRRLDGWDLTRGQRVWIAIAEGGPENEPLVCSSARIGVTSAQELQLRFFLPECPFVSGPRRRRER